MVRIEGGDSSVRISVENAGEIPSEDIEMLFEPLRQRDMPSAAAERTHLGLGLFIARQIARAHGGETVGTCAAGRVRFTIELPKAGSRGDGGEAG
ncbi:signal transduction histidine kinase [Variovorax sp. 3319]|nr:signal transduction histidine kinase [Variovorax sp. 3319]